MAFLVVGLGNPGPTYAHNRHNVGAMAVQVLADRIGGSWRRHKGGPDIVEGRLAGASVILAVPRSFMNVSGPPVAGLSRFFKIPPAEIVVLHDELDLAAHVVRVKLGGGEGGHNGLRSISAAVGSKDYLRVRIGIGRPPGRMDPADFVLADFPAADRAEVGVDLETAADAVESLITDGLLATQNKLH